MAQRKIRIGVIGHTGRGNYGHGLDVCWLKIPSCEIVAIADPDEKGRAAEAKKLQVSRTFADYRQLMDEAQPDIVAICPRYVENHRDIFLAAAKRGIHVYMEKPLCRNLAEADEMLEASKKHNIKLAVAHLTRYSPTLDVVRQLIADGKIGDLLEIRARGKEDRRGGGEDLWVLGSHMLNLMHLIGGEPEWCIGRVELDGVPVSKKDVVEGPEGLGPLAGNSVHAVYGLPNGVKGYFASVKDMGSNPRRYGVQLFGSKGILDIREGYRPTMHLLEDPAWCPPFSQAKWVPVTSNGIGKPETLDDNWRLAGNVAAAEDLIDAISEDRQPECNLIEARWTLEMIHGVFASFQAGGCPVKMPLKLRTNALALL